MKKLVFALLSVTLLSCACRQPDAGSARKLNLGKQLGAITLAAGNNNDLNIAPSGGTTTIIRLTPNSAGSTITGIDTSQLADGDIFLLRNDVVGGLVTITNGDTASAVGHRFKTPSAASIVLSAWGGVWVEWDSVQNALIASPGDSVGDRIINSTGHVRGNGTAPVLSGCGTNPAIAGSDVAGVVTTGSAATTCTLTFARTYTTAPSCFFLPTGTATQPVYTVSATAITVTTDIASTVYNYGCVGQ
jgi:hypothetical protein